VKAERTRADAEDSLADFLATLTGHGSSRDYSVILRNNMNSSDVVRAERVLREARLPVLLLTNQVTRKRGQLLEEAGCEYVDAAGNVSLSLPSFRLRVTGERSPTSPDTGRAPRDPWTDALIRGTFAILLSGTESRTWKWPLTVTWLAGAARLSLGSASKVRRLLTESGHLHRESVRSVHVLDRKRLLQDWLVAYSDRYYPKNVLDRISVSDPELDGMWGGESAAQRLTGMLTPGIETLYIDEPLARWRFRHSELLNRPAASTEVVLRSVFWRPLSDTSEITPSLLVYADLTASGEGRNLEVRDEIYERFLRAAFDED
jgi:hypothetical protein